MLLNVLMILILWCYKVADSRFILMLALVTPIIFEADYILGLWLKSVPEYTVSFVRIILFFSLVESFFASFDTFDVSYRKY